MVVPARLRRLLPAAAVGAAFTLSTPTAPAFFPPLPVGSDPITVLPPPPAPVFPVNPVIPVSPPNVPVVPPPPFVPPPVPVEPPDNPPPLNPPVVPEPGTLVSSALGLAAVGGFLWRRRKKRG